MLVAINNPPQSNIPYTLLELLGFQRRLATDDAAVTDSPCFSPRSPLGVRVNTKSVTGNMLIAWNEKG
jgi:hypothetical protein